MCPEICVALRPKSWRQGLVQYGVPFLLIPLFLFGIGKAVDDATNVNDDSWFHALRLLAVGLLVSPLVLADLSWPRNADHPSSLASSHVLMEIFLYTLFFICFTVFVFMTLATTEGQSYYYTQAVRNALIDEAFGENHVTFKDIASVPEIYEWLVAIAGPVLYSANPAFMTDFLPSVSGVPQAVRSGSSRLRQVRSPIACPELMANYSQEAVIEYQDSVGVPAAFVCGYKPDAHRFDTLHAFGDVSWHGPWNSTPGCDRSRPWEYQNDDYLVAGSSLDGIMRYLPSRSFGGRSELFQYPGGGYSAYFPSVLVNNNNTNSTGNNSSKSSNGNGSSSSNSSSSIDGDRNTSSLDSGSDDTPSPPAATTVPFSVDQFVAAIEELQAKGWIDQLTRLVSFELTFYNPPLGLWLNVQLGVELLVGGTVLPSFPLLSMGRATDSMFQSHDGSRAGTSSDSEYFDPFYFLVMTFVVYYTFELVHTAVMKRGWWRKPYVWIDALLLSLIYASYIFKLVSAAHFPKVSTSDPCAFADFGITSQYYVLSRDFLAVAMLFIFAKQLRYFMLIPGADLLPRAMGRAMGDFGLFVITFAVLFLGWTLCFHIMFAADAGEFASMGSTVLTLWATMLGGGDIDVFFETHAYVGVVLYILYTFLTTFVILTFIIAIIDSAFDSVKTSLAEEGANATTTTVASFQSTSKSSLMRAAEYLAHRKRENKGRKAAINGAAGENGSGGNSSLAGGKGGGSNGYMHADGLAMRTMARSLINVGGTSTAPMVSNPMYRSRETAIGSALSRSRLGGGYAVHWAIVREDDGQTAGIGRNNNSTTSGANRFMALAQVMQQMAKELEEMSAVEAEKATSAATDEGARSAVQGQTAAAATEALYVDTDRHRVVSNRQEWSEVGGTMA